LPKDTANVKEEKLNIVKLLKKSVFGHTEPNVHFVEKEEQ
jgi:hypothetical protein